MNEARDEYALFMCIACTIPLTITRFKVQGVNLGKNNNSRDITCTFLSSKWHGDTNDTIWEK